MTSHSELLKNVEAGKATVAVIGMGYVGLPLSLAATGAGYKVLGMDINEPRVKGLRDGKSPIRTVKDAEVAEANATGRFLPDTDFSKMADADLIIICVPTPLTRNREPDLSYIEDSAEKIAKILKAGQLVVLESTTWPGTTQQVVKPILEKKTGMKADKDFFLAYSPEREDPGNAIYTTKKIPRVVGAACKEAQELAAAFYRRIVDKVVLVSSTETAEAVKLTENIFRSVNIALVNELKMIFTRFGIDTHEVIDAASSKPFGFMPFYPGPGVGGHCIPVDPFYLTWKAREVELPTRFIELAGEINLYMPRYAIEVLTEALSRKLQKGLHGAKILLLGLAFKKNIEDVRESPALRVFELLKEKGADVTFYDPFVDELPHHHMPAAIAGEKSVVWDKSKLKNFDAAVILTDHDDIDYAAVASEIPVVVDTRNAMARKNLGSDKVFPA
ncbi:MAG: nucleotide sugar dehydrogenase [Rhizomicrobium sp.]